MNTGVDRKTRYLQAWNFVVLLTLFVAIFYLVQINSREPGRWDAETWVLLFGFVCIAAQSCWAPELPNVIGLPRAVLYFKCSNTNRPISSVPIEAPPRARSAVR